MQHLINKYNIPVPRYTSYPPANFFHENFGEQEYKDAIIASNEEQPELLSFYFTSRFVEDCATIADATRMQLPKTIRWRDTSKPCTRRLT